jgi:hypothetical protein
LGRGNQINTKSGFFQASRTIKKDPKKIQPTSFPDELQKESKSSVKNLDTIWGCSALVAHQLRLGAAELVHYRWVKGAEYVRYTCK